MRIVMLTTNLAPGGAETQVAGLAVRLERRGHEVSVISLKRPTAFADQVRIEPLHRIRELRPEVLHCHMFHANVLGRLLGLMAPVPVVISTLHSVAESPRGSGRYWPRALLYRLTEPLASHTVRVYDGPWNGVDTTQFHPPAEPPRNAHFTWLAAGRLMWKKDYPTLLAALRELPEARLRIAGTGPDEAELRRAAPANVEWLGARADMPELMRSANGFVLSSVIEGLPVVLLEAHATGLPSVATDVGGVRLTLPARLVPPADASALARAMREVMAAPPDRAAIRARAVAEFDWERVADRWETLYDRLLARRG